MILEYYSKQCLMLKKKIMSTLIKHKECVSVLQLGFTQNASRPLLFSALESLENLPNIHILYLFFSDAHDNSHHSFGCKSETVLGSNYFNYWFTQRIICSEAARIQYPLFPVLLSTTLVEYIMCAQYYNKQKEDSSLNQYSKNQTNRLLNHHFFHLSKIKQVVIKLHSKYMI